MAELKNHSLDGSNEAAVERINDILKQFEEEEKNENTEKTAQQ